MTIDVKSMIARAAPVTRKIWDTTVSVVTFCRGSTFTLGGGGLAVITAGLLALPDYVLRQYIGQGSPISDQRAGLVLFAAFGVIGLTSGLHTLHDWFHPHNQQTKRVTELESQLREAEQFANEAAESAAEAEWMRDTLAAVEYLFGIPGVLETARKAARKSLHPDGHPEAGPDEINDLTERFQMAEAVCDRFSSN